MCRVFKMHRTTSKCTAISLREAREQQLIKESIKIDLINR